VLVSTFAAKREKEVAELKADKQGVRVMPGVRGLDQV
jgi:hypothetical protein